MKRNITITITVDATQPGRHHVWDDELASKTVDIEFDGEVQAGLLVAELAKVISDNPGKHIKGEVLDLTVAN